MCGDLLFLPHYRSSWFVHISGIRYLLFGFCFFLFVLLCFVLFCLFLFFFRGMSLFAVCVYLVYSRLEKLSSPLRAVFFSALSVVEHFDSY